MSFLANLNLQKRISLLVLTGLVTGLSLFSWLGIKSVNESVDRTLEERLTIARVMATHLDHTLIYILEQLEHISSGSALPPAAQFAIAASSVRETLDRSGIFAQNILLIGRDGRVLQAEPEDARIVGADMSIYPEVLQVLQGGASTMSGLASGSPLTTPAILATVPILDKEGNIIGALVGSIDIEKSNNDALRPTIVVGKTGYTEVVDGNGIVLARTSPGLPSRAFEMSDHPGRFADLIRQRQATVGTCHRCHEAGDALQRRRDVLAFAPLFTTSWGVAIRQSEEEALAPARQLQQGLLLLGAIVLVSTFLLVWIVLQGVVRPVRALTSAAKRVAAGDFKAAIPVRRRDEIGELSAAFHTMTQELARSRDELLLRNEELSVLSSIAATVSQSLDLEEVLGNAMSKALEITKSTTGCVLLRSGDSNNLEMRSYSGPSSVFRCALSVSPAPDCACYHVLHHKHTLMINDISQCARLGDDVVNQEGVGRFVSIPLRSKNRTLGVMNIACSDELNFTEHDFKILDSIGYHVGLAIENSILYEEAKQREELRGQLLTSVINAQEEERKRIARELHDDYGQTMTGLMMSIESLEDTVMAENPSLKERLENAKSLVTRALKDIRRLTLGLRPSTLDYLGLVATVRSYAQTHLQEALGIKVDFATRGLNKRLAPAVETALFRIMQEAIHNITKYAEARQVRIRLEARDDKITAIVEDDGKGFDVDAVFKSRRAGRQSLGLLGIQERAALLGGTFNINSQVGRGTRLTVEIPVTGSLGEYDRTDRDKVEGRAEN
ncbi:MAG: GAF domain-containing protein [Chloroflexi bacterium]|nr:GAF domain-containing protein [Chloroflexota bacterium]